MDTLVMLGTTEDGTFSVSVTEEEPVSVPPTKVLQVIVHRPEVALGICAASASPGVHDTDAPTLVAIVPVALPKAYVSVCVALSVSLFVLIVTAEPRLTELEDTVGTLTPSV